MFKWNGIYLYKSEIDLRKGIDSMASLVTSAGMDPCAGDMFIFSNRKHDKFKAIYYDGVSWFLVYRRLNRGKHDWRLAGNELVRIGSVQLDWLLKGYPVQGLERFEKKRPRYS